MDHMQAGSAMNIGGRMRGYLELVRPANVVTAFADVLAGFAAAGVVADGFGPELASPWLTLAGLLASTAGLYAGGVVFNDVFDARLDAIERPERPIPSGRIPRQEAVILGSSLLMLGVGFAALVSWASAVVAALIAVGALLYDAYSKHHTWLGPVNMGACRGGNLLLGVSAVPVMLGQWWFLAIIPIVYIGAITAVSQGEVHGGESRTGWIAVGLLGAVVASLLALGVFPSYHVLYAAPFLFLLGVQVAPAFVRAARHPRPERIRKAVKAGVLALITLNAALAAGFAGWLYGLAVLALLPVSYGLGRLFKVT